MNIFMCAAHGTVKARFTVAAAALEKQKREWVGLWMLLFSTAKAFAALLPSPNAMVLNRQG
jgi:hypothetical protein